MTNNNIIIILFSLILLTNKINGNLTQKEKKEFCNDLLCDESVDRKVCGIRYEDHKATFRWFDNECALLKYGCKVEGNKAFGIINKNFCEKSESQQTENIRRSEKPCPECPATNEPVCGIRMQGPGFIVRIFQNTCQLTQYNCKNNMEYYITDNIICTNLSNYDIDMNATTTNQINKADNRAPPKAPETGNNYIYSKPKDIYENDDANYTDSVIHTSNENGESRKNTKNEVVPIGTTPETSWKDPVQKRENNIIVVKTPLIDIANINNTIKNFFASTHVIDLPVRELQPSDQVARRYMLKVFGPKKVYSPWVVVPKNISEDHYHEPTLSSCFHTCPKKCPDTYAPVCGVPGILAREPSLIFQNHCYMDAAQCKMYWDDLSDTSKTSSYIESSFIFCMGDEFTGLYRFLPLVKTLQHMGRLKMKGNYKHRIRNMKFFNEMLRQVVQPKMMG